MGTIEIGDTILWLADSKNLVKNTTYKVVSSSFDDFSVLTEDGREIFIDSGFYKDYKKVYKA